MSSKQTHTVLGVATLALLGAAFAGLGTNPKVDFLSEGGMGMYPTALLGFLLLAAAWILAFRPERRFVPLVVTLALSTLGSGALGTLVGFLHCFHAVAKSPDLVANPGRQMEAMILGVAQASHCLVLALILIVGALFAASIAAWRASRVRSAG